jgi:glycine cleavage system transcriptional repressor
VSKAIPGRDMTHYAVTAIGRDRPGIVAAISRVLLDVEGNIEDSQMSILRGNFAVMLIVSVPEAVRASDLEARLQYVRSDMDLEAITVNEVDELAPGGEPTHVLSVYGADHPGIVYAVSKALAERGANITDLKTRLAGGSAAPVYVMLMEVAVSEDAEGLRESLQRVAEEAGLDVSLRELEAEAL